MQDPQLDVALGLLIAALVVCTAAAWGLRRWQPWAGLEQRWGGARLEVAMVLGALAWGGWQVAVQLPARNPQLLPICGDMQEYLAYTTRFVDPAFGALSAYRYPLQPALAAGLCRLTGLTPVQGTQAVVLAAAALLPLALYLLGRLLAPRPVALAGALLTVATPAWIGMLGRPSDYMLSSLLMVLALAAVVAALLRGAAWRQLLAGVALAGFMAATPKALTLLLLALPLLLVAVLVRRLPAPKPLLLDLAALAAPLVLTWWVFAGFDWEIRSLEHATIRVLEYAWHEVDFPVSSSMFPEILRGQAVEGYWVVGQGAALWGLPRTIAFLLHVRDYAPAAFQGRALFVAALHSGLGLGSLLWLALVLPALTACGLAPGRGWRCRVGQVLAAAFLGLSLYILARSLTLIQPHPRYLLALASPLLLLAVVGAAACLRWLGPAWRSWQLVWLPVLLVALVVLGRQGGAVGGHARALVAAREQAGDEHPARELRGIAELTDLLRPSDQVVDFTPGGLAIASLLQRHPLLVWRPLGGALGLAAVEPNPMGRRFVVDPCETMNHEEYRAGWGANSGLFRRSTRYQRVAWCVYEDTRPELELRF